MITKVTPQISIGDASDARHLTQAKEEFHATLNVAIDLDIEDKKDDCVRTTFKRHKVGLVDGPGNDPLKMVAAVLLLHSLVRSHLNVLVHCHAGQSRSVMICAMYLDATGVCPLEEALTKIMPLRKVDIYRKDLYATATIALPIIKQVIEEYGKR